MYLRSKKYTFTNWYRAEVTSAQPILDILWLFIISITRTPYSNISHEKAEIPPALYHKFFEILSTLATSAWWTFEWYLNNFPVHWFSYNFFKLNFRKWKTSWPTRYTIGKTHHVLHWQYYFNIKGLTEEWKIIKSMCFQFKSAFWYLMELTALSKAFLSFPKKRVIIITRFCGNELLQE